MASFICRRCLSRASQISSPLRPFSVSATRSANDPASNLADLLSPTKAPRPASEPVPSANPNTPLDSSNPFLFPTGDDIPNDTNPRPNKSSTGKGGVAQTLQSFMNRRRSSPTALERHASTRAKQEAERLAVSRRSAIESQMQRVWREGDVYAPHDLSPAEQLKAKAARAPARARDMRPVNTRKGGGKDVLDDLGINPLKEYKNFKMMSEFVTEMGRIRHARDTGFRAVNQRKMAKAVRRAHGLGLLPSVHRHPELMPEREEDRRSA